MEWMRTIVIKLASRHLCCRSFPQNFIASSCFYFMFVASFKQFLSLQIICETTNKNQTEVERTVGGRSHMMLSNILWRVHSIQLLLPRVNLVNTTRSRYVCKFIARNSPQDSNQRPSSCSTKFESITPQKHSISCVWCQLSDILEVTLRILECSRKSFMNDPLL